MASFLATFASLAVKSFELALRDGFHQAIKILRLIGASCKRRGNVIEPQGAQGAQGAQRTNWKERFQSPANSANPAVEK